VQEKNRLKAIHQRENRNTNNGFGLDSKISTCDRVVLVGRLDDRCERSMRTFFDR
jgi:hypothetical protein